MLLRPESKLREMRPELPAELLLVKHQALPEVLLQVSRQG